jgi:hypothetical protein
MRTPIEFVACLFAAATTLVTLPAAAQDADSQEVMHYTLTDAGLAKYTKASHNLAALAGGPPGCAKDDDSDSESNSISDLAGKLDAAPGAKAAVQSAGMTSREYIVFSMALLQNGLAAWALTQPGGKLPPGVNKANVDFVNSHGPQLDKLKGLDKKCGEDEDAEEEPEE